MNKATQLSNRVKSVNLDIDGMTCAACAARVERVLTKSKYVLDASVSFPLKSAIVDVTDDESFDFDEIIKSVKVESSSGLDLPMISNMLDEQGYTVVESN